MLFELSRRYHPNAVHTAVIPEAYAGLGLPKHEVNVTIDDDCTLIRQAAQKQGYSFLVNNFFINNPVKLYITPVEEMHFLYYSMEGTLNLTIANKVRKIQPGVVRLLQLPIGSHYADFKKGVYTSLHVLVNEANKLILKDQDLVMSILREHFGF
jgi:hypothetical protein